MTIYYDKHTGEGPGLVEAELIPDGFVAMTTPEGAEESKVTMVGLERRTKARIAFDNSYGCPEPELWHVALTIKSGEWEVIQLYLGLENLKKLHDLIGEFLVKEPSYVLS